MSESDEQTSQDSVIFDKKLFAFLTTRPIGMAEKIAALIVLEKRQKQTDNTVIAEETDD